MASHFEFPNTYEQLETIAKHTRRDALSNSIYDVNGNALRVIESLGGGGQMNVFRVHYNGEQYALGLPHDDGFHRWEDRITTEVATTNNVRYIGIPTHPMLEPIQLRIAKSYIPGLLMYPFDSLDCDVRQGDGYYGSRFDFPMQFSELSEESLPFVFRYIVNEIAALAHNGFHHRFSLENIADCINYSVFSDGSLHLFLTDMGTMTFDHRIPTEGKQAIGVYMLMKTLQFLGNALPKDQFDKNQQYLQQLEKDAGVLLNSKAEKVTLKEIFTLTDMVLAEIS